MSRLLIVHGTAGPVRTDASVRLEWVTSMLDGLALAGWPAPAFDADRDITLVNLDDAPTPSPHPTRSGKPPSSTGAGGRPVSTRRHRPAGPARSRTGWRGRDTSLACRPATWSPRSGRYAPTSPATISAGARRTESGRRSSLGPVPSSGTVWVPWRR
ncbi:hypothetical protein [Phytohabitans rumicis]|uniref:Uncharacterized protein n=1 Tax=Phytohabitans rumicis TaxID=1076125 RepID=A0A6V8KNM7_9ACTN|nr:hypothetical protein [Phytohabitans rumicis]GFJ86763.1 hypothetical protein Prum_004050 [Phytohabitans rumicis]